MRTPDISAQIAEIAADPNAYVAETRRRARASAAPLSSLADHADERFTEAQLAKVTEFDAAPEPPEIIVERAARALREVERHPDELTWADLPEHYKPGWRRMAIAAIAALDPS